MPDFLDHTHYYLVGLKGVAMTALAACLSDAAKTVAGADVAEDFVTAAQLRSLRITPDVGFDHQLPVTTQVLIYSGAHGGRTNPLVQQALARQLPVYSHAQALAALFNPQLGWAVCGANGKSTVSALLAFVLTKAGARPNYVVGVGRINGLEHTGRYYLDQVPHLFIAEADEYVEDITQYDPQLGPQARFLRLRPQLIIANNLSWDHPDVFRDLAQTQAVYSQFFQNLAPQGRLIVNLDDPQLQPAVATARQQRPDIQVTTFGQSPAADLRLLDTRISSGQSHTRVSWQGQELTFSLRIPGAYNVANALATLTACLVASDLSWEQLAPQLAAFASTARRYELLGERAGVLYIDDYAHHPDEISAVIAATRQWYPERRLVVGFQSHTYTRTLNLFSEFVHSLAAADQVVMIDIFPSARESAALATQVSSDQLCAALNQLWPPTPAANVHTIANLAHWCTTNLHPGDVFLCLGAGDIYHFWDLLAQIQPN